MEFAKYCAAGNDFVLMRESEAVRAGDDLAAVARRLCDRRRGIGADGLITVEPDPSGGVRMRIFNPDGSEAEMCGNGARAAAHFASAIGLAGESMTLVTLAGPIEARVDGDAASISYGLLPGRPEEMTLPVPGGKVQLWFYNSGVPHAVIPVEDVAAVDLPKLAPPLRRHKQFGKAGTNVDVIERTPGGIRMRTWERGVEGETLACGTGAIASALAAHELWGLDSPVTVEATGGALTVSFKAARSGYEKVALAGETRLVYRGKLS